MSSQHAQTTDAPSLTFRALVQPASFNVDSRTVDVTWSTGAPVTRSDWITGENYIEALSMSPKAIRMERLNAGAPVLDSHNAKSTGSVLAAVVPGSAKSDGVRGVATIKFSRRPDAESVMQDVKDGVLRNVSVGYVVHRWDVVKASKSSLEKRTAVDWEPYEISLVPVPADVGAQVRERPKVVGKDREKMEAEDVISAERTRVASIDELCTAHNIEAAQRSAWLRDGTDVDDVRGVILARLADRSRETRISSALLGDGRRELSMVRDAADALAHRAGVKVSGEGFRHFADARLLDIARNVLEVGGVSTRLMGGNSIATRALASSDFGAIIGAAGDKIVRSAYEAVPLAHREVLRQTTANDFRAKHSISNASASVLPEVPEGGVYPRRSVLAEKASYALKTYGDVIPITRQLVVNDDFGLVESASRQRGRSAAETERNVVWSFILGNPAATDGNAMFDNAKHGNYPAASATPISATTLAAARKALRTALSPDGFPVNGLLKHIVVAPSGEVAFDQLLNGVYVPQAAGTAITPTMRNVMIHVEPLISATKSSWFGFTDFAQCDHFEFAYLTGSNGPRVEERVNFDTDSLDLKVVLDFGIGAIDWRGVYYQRET